MLVCVIPKGSYVYVTNAAEDPGNKAVMGFRGQPPHVVGRASFVFRSVREVRYPKSDEVATSCSRTSIIRIFKLPENAVGEFLVVINNDRDLGVFDVVREEEV